MDLSLEGNVYHTVRNPGKMTIGTPSRGGEIVITFDPSAPFEEGKLLIENGMRLLEYAKYLHNNPDNIPPIVVKSQGATAKVG
jgi:hypothetical protein